MKVSVVPVLALLSGASALSSQASSSTRAPNPVIKVMANGMNLLKPAFVAEAKLQASVLGRNVDLEVVEKEIAKEVQSNKVVIYTYGLSPFSSEALEILDSTGIDYTQIELGPEWFLLNGKDSVKRVALAQKMEGGATSLPKIFVNGQCIGGCAELAESVESGTFDSLTKQSTQPKNKLFPFL